MIRLSHELLKSLDNELICSDICEYTLIPPFYCFSRGQETSVLKTWMFGSP